MADGSRGGASKSSARTFVDVFAGCGGLSLGLTEAGWSGLFAIEKDAFAFDTFKENLLGPRAGRFNWPKWLSASPHCIKSLLETHRQELQAFRGKVDLLVGGPPCQGFSSAGRRRSADPRNALVQNYLELVDVLRPRAVLLENVNGIKVDFRATAGSAPVNYAELLIETLSKEYFVHWRMLNVAEFGVPQARTRFFLLARRKDCFQTNTDPFALLEAARLKFLRSRNLLSRVSAMSAISDLELGRNKRVACDDSPGFDAIGYRGPRTQYQRLMHANADAITDTRLAKHRPEIVARFEEIIRTCNADGRLNVSLSRELRERLGVNKLALRVLDPDRPAPTITSMPDDLLHYREPRTLTVRENARLQSFPDWFRFKGKYTTGGERRRKEVPRFTQVANAVPPLMAEVLGLTISLWLGEG